MEALGRIAKAGLIMFAVGALLATVAAPITVALGFAPTIEAALPVLGFNAKPLWLGAFFASFGAIQAAISPPIEKTIVKIKEGPRKRRAQEGPTLTEALAVAESKTPEVQEESEKTFQEKEMARRAATSELSAQR